MFSRIVGRISGYSVLAIAIFLGSLMASGIPDRSNTKKRDLSRPGIANSCMRFTHLVCGRTAQPTTRLGGRDGAAPRVVLADPGRGCLDPAALVFFLLWAGFRARLTASIAPAVIAPAAMTAAVFLVVPCVLSFGNWMAYGQFIGVDFKERNFKRQWERCKASGKKCRSHIFRYRAGRAKGSML